MSAVGGVEVDFLYVTPASSFFVIVYWWAPGFNFGVYVFTVKREVGHPYFITEVSYTFLVSSYLVLEECIVFVFGVSVKEVAKEGEGGG